MPTRDDPEEPLPSALLVGELSVVIERIRASAPSGPDDALLRSAAAALGQAIAERDAVALKFALDALDLGVEVAPSEKRGVLRSLRTLVEVALEPLTSARSSLEPGSMQARMLQALLAEPELTNIELCERLGTDATQLSRAGRKLAETGLAQRHKRGRTNRWIVTPAGRTAAAAAALSGQGADDHAATLLTRLLRATSDAETAAAAVGLARLGASERRSANTRGSIVRAAPARLPEEGEADLIAVLDRAGSARDDVVSCLAEWGSTSAAAAIAEQVRRARAGVEFVGALRRLGGPDASIALALMLGQELQRLEPRGDAASELVGAITELITGGRIDMTAGGSQASHDERWTPDDMARAEEALQAVRGVLEEAGLHPGISSYVRQRSALSRHQLDEWSEANGLPMPADGASLGPGARFTVEVGDWEPLEIETTPSSIDAVDVRLREMAWSESWSESRVVSLLDQLRSALGEDASIPPHLRAGATLIEAELIDASGKEARLPDGDDLPIPHRARLAALTARRAMRRHDHPVTDGLEELANRCAAVGAVHEVTELLFATADAESTDRRAAAAHYDLASRLAHDAGDFREGLAIVGRIGAQDGSRAQQLDDAIATVASDEAQAIVRTAHAWADGRPEELFVAVSLEADTIRLSSGWPVGPAGRAVLSVPTMGGSGELASFAIDRLDGLLLGAVIPAGTADATTLLGEGFDTKTGARPVPQALVSMTETLMAVDDLVELLRGVDGPTQSDLRWLPAHLDRLHSATETLRGVRDIALLDGRQAGAFKSATWEALGLRLEERGAALPEPPTARDFERELRRMASNQGERRETARILGTAESSGRSRFECVAACAKAARWSRAGRRITSIKQLEQWRWFDQSRADLASALVSGPPEAGWAWSRRVLQPAWAR